MLAPGFLDGVQRKGERLRAGLERLVREFPIVFEDARGMGLLQGLKCAIPVAEAQAACIAEGLLPITAGENVLRLAPPLVITEAEIDQALDMLSRGARRAQPSAAKAAAK